MSRLFPLYNRAIQMISEVDDLQDLNSAGTYTTTLYNT